MNRQQKTTLLIIGLFLFIGLAVSLYLMQKVTKPAPRAAENKVVFTLVPSNPRPQPGEEIDVAVFVKPPEDGTAIRMVSAYINYDNSDNSMNNIQILGISKGGPDSIFNNENWDILAADQGPEGIKRIKIIAVSQLFEERPDEKNYLRGGTPQQLAVITLKWGSEISNNNSPGVLTFDISPTTTSAKDPDGNDVPVAAENLTIPAITVPTGTNEPLPTPELTGALRLSPFEGEFNPGEFFATKILLDTGGQSVVSTDAILNYNPNFLKPIFVENGGAFPQFFHQLNAAGQIYIGGSVDYPETTAAEESGSEPINGNNKTLATIMWQIPAGAAATQGTNLEFDCSPGKTDDSNITASDPNASDILDCAKIQNGVYSVGNTPAPETNYILEPRPSNNIEMEPSAPNTGYEIMAILKRNGEVVVDQSDLTYRWYITNPEIADLTPFAACTDGIQDPCPEDHATIFAKRPGAARITATVYRTNDAGDYEVLASVDYNLTVTGSQLTPPPDNSTPSASLSFKIAFQGVTPQTAEKERSTALPDPKKQNVLVKIVNPVLKINESYPNVPATYSEKDSNEAKAVYKGSVELTGVKPGAGYLVFIKGPRHLQKLFCQDKPKGPCRSRLASKINFAAGENEYDFSTLSLEAGDLPDPNANMSQDGVIDARDWERLRSIMTIFPADQNALNMQVADLDLDGKVNTQDAGLMQDTFFSKYEEDEEAFYQTQ